MLRYPGDLRQYVAGVCPFLYGVPEVRSAASDSSDYVSYRGKGMVGKKAVWVVSVDLAEGADNGLTESETLSIDRRTLFWAEAQYEFSSPAYGEQWSASYSRFNKPISIRLPKIGSTTP
jgi:hypothetical protein